MNQSTIGNNYDRREFLKTLGLGAGALAVPSFLLNIPTAQANPVLFFLMRLVPFFGRRTLMRAASRGVIRSAARVATSRQVIRGATIGGGSLLGTASTAYAAYDVMSMVSMFSEPVQTAVEEYQYHPESQKRKIGMIWDADEPNSFMIKGKNFSDSTIADSLMMSIYDIRKGEYIKQIEMDELVVPAGGILDYQSFTILRLPRSLVAGDMIVIDIHLKHSMDKVIFEPSDAIVIERT